VTVRDCDLQKISILSELPYNNDGAAAPEQPYFRNFRFINLDLSKAKPSTTVVLANGFPASRHRTTNVAFENIKLPLGAVVQVDQAKNVTFSHVTCADGRQPTFQVTQSEEVTY
jgi:hypothetical protein